MTGLLIRIINNHFLVIGAETFHSALTYTLFIGAIDSFLIIVNKRAYKVISSPRISRILLLLSLVPLIVLFVLPLESVLFLLSLGFILLGYLYILIIQYRLVKMTRGDIKKRLALILAGEIFILASILAGSQGVRELFIRENDLLSILISIPFLLTGLSLIFLGELKFPAFFEFGWRENLVELFIFHQSSQKKLFSFDFTEKEKMAIKDSTSETETSLSDGKRKELLSPALIAIKEILSRASNLGPDTQTLSIKQGDLTILLEYGNEKNPELLFLLMVEKEMASLQYFLKLIKKQFQGFYSEVLLDFEHLAGYEQNIFSHFEMIITHLLK